MRQLQVKLYLSCCLILLSGAATTLHMENKYPCAFIDTINITDSVRASEAAPTSTTTTTATTTYLHDSLVIPRELVAIYDFIIRNGVRVPAPRHFRACICKLKPCIRFCCAQGYYYDVTNHTCRDSAEHEINASLNETSMIVHMRNGSVARVQTASQFNIHNGSPCEHMRLSFKEPDELVTWNLYENGTISYQHHLFTKQYCYSPYRLENKTWIWQPLACSTEKIIFVLGVREWTYVACLILATICMGIILFTHLLCKEIRTTFYGCAIKSYTICTIVGYSLMIHLMLTEPTQLSKISCVFMPCAILMFLLLSFYVLTFLSFNFYLNFHGVVLTHIMFWLIFFPIVSLAVGWSLFTSSSEYNGKPVFGGETCWFDPRNWAIMLYFYAPVFVACVVSIFFYILTQVQIMEGNENETKTQSTIIEENRYSSFCTFLCYTFIMWLVCVISFIINYNRYERTHINYVVCLFVALHGFGSLYALVGKNQQIQNFLRRIEEDIDDEDEEVCETTIPMRPLA